MNGSRHLARAIRDLARRHLRESRVLWKEYRRLRQPFWRRALVLLAFAPLIYVAALGVVLVQDKTRELPLLMLTLYSTATALSRADKLQQLLYRSLDLAFFMHYPVTDRQFFVFEWRKFLRSTWLVLFYCLLAFGYLAFIANQAGAWLAALAAAILQWAVVLSLIVMVNVLASAWSKKVLVATVCYLLALACPFIPEKLVALLNEGLGWLPTAWIPHAFYGGVFEPRADGLYPLIPALLVLVSIVWFAKRLRVTYPVVELEYPAAAVAAPDEDEFAPESEPALPSESAAGEESIETLHLASLNWEKVGWIERVVGRSLSERERAVAEFLCGGRLGMWSGGWLRGAKIGLVGTVVLLVPLHLPTTIYVGFGAVAAMLAMPALGGYWEGMQLRGFGGSVSPAYAGLPLGYFETSRTMAKINLLRVLAWTPFLLLYATVFAWRFGSPPVEGTMWAAQLIVLVLIFQPLAILGQHSRGTNDSGRVNWHRLLTAILIAPLAFVLVACIMVFWVANAWAPYGERLIPAILAALVMLICCSLVWLIYGVLYGRGRIDLIRAP